MSTLRTPLEALRAIMEAYNLTRGDVAKLNPSRQLVTAHTSETPVIQLRVTGV